LARRIGSRYTVHQVIGRGSAGTVWLGEGPQGPVAVKLLREDLASDQVLVGRFVQERTALTSLDHPRVVGVHDMVVDGSDLALVMELVHGTDLRSLLDRDGPLAPQAAASIVADVAEGLAVAHAAGIVHRDVKPENILLDLAAPAGPGGAPRAKLTDFGIARLVDAPRRTRATRIIGTPDYLAPEIIEGLEPRAAVDIYALATVLYELLAGFTPFGGGHTGAVLRRHVTESVPPLPGLPEQLTRVMSECLAKAPASRLRATELAERLRDLLPALADLPPLALPAGDEPGAPDAARAPLAGRGSAARRTASAVGAPADTARAGEEDSQEAAPGIATGRGSGPRRRGPAVPLVTGRRPDSTRDTHTSLRRPSHQELAAYAEESRAQRAVEEARRAARAGSSAAGDRAGSAHHRHRRPGPPPGGTVLRRRRLIAAAIAALVVGGAVAAYAASGSGDSRGAGISQDGTSSQSAGSVARDVSASASARPDAPVAQDAAASATASAGASATADALPGWAAWTTAPAPPGALSGGLRAVSYGGADLVFGTDAQGAVWYLTHTAAGFGSWTKLTGIHVSGAPAAVPLSGSRLRLFARGSDGLLYQRTLSDGRWTPWGQLDGRTHYDSAPAAVSADGTDVVLVARIGTDLVTTSSQDGVWSAPATVPTAGKITGDPVLVAQNAHRVDVFVRPAGGAQVLRVPAFDGVWHPAQTVTGLASADKAVGAVRSPGGACYLFALAPGTTTLDEAVSARSAGTSGATGPWRVGPVPGAVGPATDSAPAAVTDSTGVALFVGASDGTIRYTHTT